MAAGIQKALATTEISPADIRFVVPHQAGTGITDVHSASEKISPFEKTAYNTW